MKLVNFHFASFFGSLLLFASVAYGIGECKTNEGDPYGWVESDEETQEEAACQNQLPCIGQYQCANGAFPGIPTCQYKTRINYVAVGDCETQYGNSVQCDKCSGDGKRYCARVAFYSTRIGGACFTVCGYGNYYGGKCL
ncbi:hypothetical protein V7x_55140 [Crateriforma conspicua]|uniref:Uncharacterized protein n=2 Tax=Planctomycetaceae TaxID=126 RepID=A0A5C6FIX1_9PLAN|nr:hypothetical protein V7x_55140 [Crateriforma conspicua]